MTRHELGQWFTPGPVADLALGLALDDGFAPRRVLDPTCGDGAMLARAAIALPRASLVGVELDAAAAAAARARLPRAKVIEGDVLDGAVDGGFDLVIGNPPWVRPERLPEARRAKMSAALREDAGVEAEALVRRADLAAACVLRAIALTRAGGRVAMVLSTALLDAGYARPLWRAVRARGAVRVLVAAPAERWFGDAAVNAMIAVIHVGGGRGVAARATPERLSAGATPAPADQLGVIDGAVASATKIARLKVPTTAARGPLATIADVREVAGDDPSAWGAALRASGAWFEIAGAANGALVPLAELATLYRGTTSGANEVFYLARADAARAGLEADVLAPLVHSPRDGAELPIAIDPDATPLYALVIPKGGLAARPGARRWIKKHRAAGLRPSARTRDPWWSLPVKPARLFLTKAYGPRFVQRLAPRPVVADQRVYAVAPRAGVGLEQLAAALNTTWTALALESLGRASMGHGAVEWTVADAERLPVLDVRRADARTRAAIERAFAAIVARAVRHVNVERDLADRRALDLAVARIAPELAGLLGAAHEGLCTSVALRDRWKLPIVR